MDLVYSSFKLILYFFILFVFVFVIANMYIDLTNDLREKDNIKKVKKYKKNVRNWWGIKPLKWWNIFNNKNEKHNKKMEEFVNVRQRSFNDNKFQKIILPDVKNYDLEIAVPMDQKIYATVQGNWGFNTDEYGEGFSIGIYRDGYTADGSLLKGVSEKRYKFMLERGPYVIKYEVRQNENPNQDIKVFVNNKEVLYVKNEGVSSGKLQFIGTNETILNKKTDSTAEGRRPLDYLKFIPKSNELNN